MRLGSTCSKRWPTDGEASDPQAALGRLKDTTDPFLRLSLLNALRNEGDRQGDPALIEGIAATPPRRKRPADPLSRARSTYKRIAQNDPGKGADAAERRR